MAALQVSDIAQVAHEASRAYCHALGDDSQKPWDEAPEWARTSAIKGVEFHLANPDAMDAEWPEAYDLAQIGTVAAAGRVLAMFAEARACAESMR